MERHSMRCGTEPGPAKALRMVPPASNCPGCLGWDPQKQQLRRGFVIIGSHFQRKGLEVRGSGEGRRLNPKVAAGEAFSEGHPSRTSEAAQNHPVRRRGVTRLYVCTRGFYLEMNCPPGGI